MARTDPHQSRIAALIEASAAALAERWTRRHLRVQAIQEGVVAEAFPDPLGDYANAYLQPLLKLIAGYARTGVEDYADVYADERMRFTGPRPQAAEIASLRETIAEDEHDLLQLTADEPRLRQCMAATLRELHGGLFDPIAECKLSMTLVGDCLMTEIRAFLVARARRAGIGLDTTHFYFSARQGVGLDGAEVRRHLADTPTELVALSFLTFEGIPPYQALLAESDDLTHAQLVERATAIVNLIGNYIEGIREVTAAPVLVHGSCGLPLTRYRKRLRLAPALSRGRRQAIEMLNAGVRELVAHSENAIFLDEADVCSTFGLRDAGRPKFPSTITDGAMFHTTRLGSYIAPRYLDVVEAFLTLHRTKVLLVDFDNTLWDGVMAEGPVTHHRERQRLLVELRQAGMLLVSVSKNTPEAIRWEEMELDERDFVLHKVSWNQKAQSIDEAAQQLDLSPDSFVLLDDNPAERELVSVCLPGVRTLDPDDPATWRWLKWMFEFPNTRRTAEAARRTEMYREAAQRRNSLSANLDYEAMMSSLQLSATFGRARRGDLDRLHELLARTNQFNTTTRRHSKADLLAMIDDERRRVYVSSLADKFGSLGIVGVVIVERLGPDIGLDSVVMSCRAMGFGLEYMLLRATLDAELPWQRAIGSYITTARNNPCAELFSSAGFTHDGDGIWVLDAESGLPDLPSWLSVTAH